MASKQTEVSKLKKAASIAKQATEVNEVDGEPIYHAPEEEGEYHE